MIIQRTLRSGSSLRYLFLLLVSIAQLSTNIILESQQQQQLYSQNDAKCEPIIAPLCSSAGYENTIMPNLLGHQEQKQAISSLNDVAPLLRFNCSKYLHLFVCSVFFPVCTMEKPTPLPVCRNLCETVQTDCLSLLRRLPLEWPAHLNCTNFPEPPKLCIQLPNETTSLSNGGENDEKSEEDLNFKPRCPERFVKTKSECVPLCNTDSFYRSNDKEFVQKWNIFWSWLAFAITFFTLLTFLLDTNRLQYPERPIVYTSLSRLCITIPPILKHFFENDTMICHGNRLIVNSSMENWPCTIGALSSLYFNLTSCFWFLVFCVGWYLSAAKNWSTEAIQSFSKMFHVIVWSAPVIPTLITFLGNELSADELTGLCQINETNIMWFVAVPNAVVLTVCAFLTYNTAAALTRVRKTIKIVYKNAAKLEKLMVRLLVFSALQILPTLAVIFCIFHEAWHRPRWKSLSLLSAFDCDAQNDCLPGPIYRSAGIEIVTLHIFASMMTAINSGTWIWSSKTLKNWIKFIRVLFAGKLTSKSDQDIPIVHL